MKIDKKIGLLLLGVLLFAIASPALAYNAGDAATHIRDQVGSFRTLLLALVFLVGLGVGLVAALKFKAHSENAQQVPLKVPLVYTIVAALLVGFPVFMSVGKNSLFGDEGQSIDDMGSFAD